MSHSNEPPAFVEVTKNTLLLARASGATVEFFSECALDDKSAIEQALSVLRPDWNTQGLPAITALTPRSVFWHLASPEEAASHRTDEALRQFGVELPHQLTGALELTGCHADDGSPISPENAARWVLGLSSTVNLALTTALAAEWRIESVRAESATLAHIGAIVTALRAAGSGSVALWDLGVEHSQLLLITPRGIEGVAPCPIGFDEIFTIVQSAMALKFRGTAGRFFFNESSDFSATGAMIGALVAPALVAACAALPTGGRPPALACTGLTGRQAWFVRATALAAELQAWSPDTPLLCHQLGLRVDDPKILSALSPSSFGLLHLISAQARGSHAWRSSWSRAGITSLVAPAAAPLAASPTPLTASRPTPVLSLTTPPMSRAPAQTADSLTPSELSSAHASKLTPSPVKADPAPAGPPKMPDRIVARLRDEAYAHLCRQSLTEALAKLEKEKQEIISSRPVFAILATKKSRESYETSLQAARQLETEYRQQLKHLEEIDTWLQSSIQEGLDLYLGTASAEYKAFGEIGILVERWQNSVGSLHDHVLAFARDARAVGAVVGTKAAPASAPLQHAFSTLRSTASHLHGKTLQLDLLGSEVIRLSTGKIPSAAAMPLSPEFRQTNWVDRVILLRPAEIAQELQLAETEARSFCSLGKNELLLRAESVRSACLHARLEFLNNYWSQLRQHALLHYVEPRDVDRVVVELTRAYVAADLEKRRQDDTNSPFSLER